MSCLPHIVFMAPFDEVELMYMVATVAVIDTRPSCFRFPRGNEIIAILPPDNKEPQLRIRMECDRVAILGYCSIIQKCVEAATMLKSREISMTVVDARSIHFIPLTRR